MPHTAQFRPLPLPRGWPEQIEPHRRPHYPPTARLAIGRTSNRPWLVPRPNSQHLPGEPTHHCFLDGGARRTRFQVL